MKKKILSVILAIVIMVAQFTALGGAFSVGATSYSALTGRSDFDFGMNIHEILNYAAFTETYSAIRDSYSLGANLIRLGISSNDDGYLNDVLSVAEQYDMNLMLVDSYFKTFVRSGSDYENVIAYSNVDIAGVTDYYTALATKCAGKVKYYQLGNELDNRYKLSGANGTLTAHYEDVKGLAEAIYAATNAIHAVDPSAKVVVNFSWTHYGFIKAIKSVKIKPSTGLYNALGTATATWDVTGMDFYNATDASVTYADVIEALEGYSEENPTKYPEKFMVCEANLKATGWNESDHDDVTYNGDASWLGDFITTVYNNSNFVGFIPYELYDEPAHTNHGTTFHAEAFFGLIDRNGVKKDTYNVVQSLFGGTDHPRTAPTVAPAVNNTGSTLYTVFSGLYTDTMPTKLYRSGDASFLTLEEELSEISAFDQMKSIEFDIYIEDKDALDSITENNDILFKAIIKDNNGKVREARSLPTSLIYQNGWNHIVLSRAQFSQGSGAYWNDGIAKFTFGFHGISTEQYSAISGMNIAIANLCVTDVDSYETESAVGTKIANQPNMSIATLTFGGTNSNGSACTNFTGIARQNITFTPVYLTGADHIEFDIYINDYSAYRSAMTNASAQFRIMFTTRAAGAGWDRRKGYNITDMITKDGWNHIILRIADYTANDATTPLNSASSDSATATSDTNTADHVFYSGGLQRVYFAYYASNTSATNPIASQQFRVSNIIATKKTTPEVDTELPVISTLSAEGTTNSIGGAYSRLGINVFKISNLAETDLSRADNIEFDFFVPSLDILKADMTAKGVTNMSIRFSSHATNPDSNCANYTFLSQLTRSGWNHVVLPKTSYYSQNSIDWTAIKSFKVYPNGTTSGTCDQSAQQLTIANIEVTGIICPLKNTCNWQDALIYNNIQKNHMGTDFTTTIQNYGFTSIDISKAEYLEFDFYVADCETFKSAIVKDNANRSLCMRISSTTGGDKSVDSLTLRRVSDEIFVDGWNHIILPISDFKKESTSGTFDATNLRNYSFYFDGTLSDTNTAFGQQIAVANLTATRNITIPEPFSEDKTNLITNSYIFKGKTVVSSLSSTTDIGSRMMLEFNIHKDYTTSESVTLTIKDTSGNTGTFTVSCGADGWNHFCVRKSDFAGISGVDCANISSISIVGESSGYYMMSGLYGEDYIDGDADRDGDIDIIDLVMADDYAVTPSKYNIVGFNICAVDLNNNDYTISSDDITSVARIVLAN